MLSHCFNGYWYQHKAAGNTQEGIQKYFEALKIDPHYAPAYYNLGVVYSEIMQYDMALTFYEKAASERPMYAEAYCNMGVLAVSPNFEIAKNNMAIALTDLGTKVKLEGDINRGVAFYKKALYYNWHYADAILLCQSKPNFSQSLNNLGVVYTVQGKMDAAASMIEKAIIANPTYAEAYNNLGVLYRDAGDIALAINAYEQCLKIDPDSRNAGQADAKTIRFREKVLKKGGIWKDIYGTDEKKVADMVREDQVDILVELTGHTANNKLGMMACRPAPVQVTWIGYPNTTGLPTIDYRITDSLADPPETKQKHVEELVRLPDCFLCYTPSPEAGPVCQTPALSNGFITFGSFNNLAKITPKVLKVWARILCSIPNSRLVNSMIQNSELSTSFHWSGTFDCQKKDEYVKLALKLASDISALQNLRMSLRELMSKSPLCDGAKFILGLESTYRHIWRRYCKGDVPSLKRMELLQQPVSNGDPSSTNSEPTRVINSSEGSPGSVKANGFNLMQPSKPNIHGCEENGH
ncbi:Tetratricopeptide-like helical domain superfamily [Sesbania bispinosa]|nr:Tetratricopeptide-like helical domain superfamily [Sesbania bispinosa]